MINLKLFSVWLVILAVVYCLPAEKSNEHQGKSCKPGFCERAKMDCKSCNTTLASRKDPCNCCASCKTYIEEGDRCVPEDLPPYESTTAGNEMNKEIIKSEESVNKGKECKSGLLCLQGTCVTLF